MIVAATTTTILAERRYQKQQRGNKLTVPPPYKLKFVFIYLLSLFFGIPTLEDVIQLNPQVEPNANANENEKRDKNYSSCSAIGHGGRVRLTIKY